MKRSAVVVFVSLVLVLFAIEVGYRGLTYAENAENDEESAAVVQLKKGDCTFKPSGDEEWKAVAEKEEYSRDTCLKTGPNSFMQIAFDDFNSFRMKSNTEVVVAGIEELAEEKGGGIVKIIKLDILDGEVGVKLEQLPKDHIMKVSGPTAVAGASGTGFSVLANKIAKTTKVAVFESKVLVEAFDKPNKGVELAEYQEATAAPWKGTMITGTGVGYLSARILGEDFIDNLKEPVDEIKIEARGAGTPPDDAKDRDERREAAEKLALEDAYTNMAKIIMPMSIDDEKKVADLLKNDPELSKKVYEVIAASEPKDLTFADDDGATVTVEINLTDLSKALGVDLTRVMASVREITRAEYLEKFGAEAYQTTLRAAETVAQRDIVERLYGSVIVIGSTLRDKAADDGSITIKVQGIVRGAKTAVRRFFADGSIQVTMEAPGDQVQTELGEELVGTTWLTSPEAAKIEDFTMMKALAE